MTPEIKTIYILRHHAGRQFIQHARGVGGAKTTDLTPDLQQAWRFVTETEAKGALPATPIPHAWDVVPVQFSNGLATLPPQDGAA